MKTIVHGKEEETSIVLKVREDNSVKFFRLPFSNYIYVKSKDFEDHSFIFKNFSKEHEEVEFSDGDYCKVYLENNFNRYKLVQKLQEKGVQTFQSDISSVKNWVLSSVDKTQAIGIKTIMLDIETVDLFELKKDMTGLIVADAPILSIAFTDEEGSEHFIINKSQPLLKETPIYNFDFINNRTRENRAKFIQEYNNVLPLLLEGEKKLLEETIHFLKNYDISFSWNGNRFDIPYLEQRCEFHGLDFKKFLHVGMDYMEMYKKNVYESLTSYSLQNVCTHEFSSTSQDSIKYGEEVNKIDWKSKTKCTSIFELFVFEPTILEEYNRQDTRLMYMIEEKYHFKKLHAMLADICGAFFYETLQESKMIDMFLLRKALARNMISPSKPSKDEVEKRSDRVYGDNVGGGYTFCYEPGFYKNLHGFDFSSHYPTAVISHNIGIENFVRTYPIKLHLLFSENECLFIKSVLQLIEEVPSKVKNDKGELNKNKYERKISELQRKFGVSLSMEDVMWKLVSDYQDPEFLDYIQKNDYTYCDFDLNYDTVGWRLHPYRVYSKQYESVLSESMKFALMNRAETRKEMKSVEKGSFKWQELDVRQVGFKRLANSMYGYTALKSARHYHYDVCDAITATCRMLTKRCILHARNNGVKVIAGDTDSNYLLYSGSVDDLKKLYFDFFKNWHSFFNYDAKFPRANPYTGEEELLTHAKLFDYEKTFDSCIYVKKKRYYYKKGEKYGTQGGAYKKSDTILLAKEWQKKLTKDILDDTFDKELWKNQINSLREEVYNLKLNKKYLLKYAGVSRPIEMYGQPMIDKNTGKQKVTTDGRLRFSPVPAHIAVAKELVRLGKEVDVGDKIAYVVESYEDGKIKAIAEEVFDEKKVYCPEYYWERVVSVLVEILKVTHPNEVFTYFAECWGYTDKQLEKKLEQLQNEEDTEDDE